MQGSGFAEVLVVNPSLSITKQCVTNCAPYSSPYGEPIVFTGTVCNNGDVTLPWRHRHGCAPCDNYLRNDHLLWDQRLPVHRWRTVAAGRVRELPGH